MTTQEIEDIILLSLFQTKDSGYLSFSKILAENGLPARQDELIDLSNDLDKRGLIKHANTKDGAAGRILTEGRKFVENNLLKKYDNAQFGLLDAQKILYETGFSQSDFSNKLGSDSNPTRIIINFNIGDRQPSFDWYVYPLTRHIHSYPTVPPEEPISLPETLTYFRKWAEEVFKLKPEGDISHIFHALSIDPNDKRLAELSFHNQGITGYVMLNETDGSRPIFQYESKIDSRKFFYAFNPDTEDLQKNGLVLLTNTQAWYLMETESPNTRPLRRFSKHLRNRVSDHFYSFNPLVEKLNDLKYSEEKGLGHIFTEPGEGRTALYVYSTNKDKLFFEPLSVTKQESINEVVRLQGDGSTVDDQLLRKPFVNALKSHIERYWKEADNQDSYTIHLDGEWGSGKSSILDMLELNLQKDKWTVVRYNAWQNQHLEKPWWVLLYKLYQAILSSEPIEFRRMRLKWYNFKWKVVLPNKAVILSTVLIAFALYILFNSFGSGWLFSLEPTTESWLKIVGLSITIFGGIWATSNFVVNTILSGSSKPEDSFYKKLSDPMDSLKSYFKNIVSISSKNTAIFIDDLDRCREGTTVGLLEGIQTLFKDQKVLYIIAGDGQWISTCFEVHYSAFKHDKAGHSLGDSFLAKVFQMSTAVPTMSPEAKGQYLRHLLNIDTSSKQGMKNSNEITDEIKQATSETELSNIIQVNKNKANVNHQALRISASEKLSELDLKKDISHVLIAHENDLEPNARSIKRFINNYSLARNSLFLEGKTLADISQPSLIKWLIVCSRWPSYSYALKKDPNELDNIKNKDSVFNGYAKGWLTVDLLKKLS
jgi:hypothetical protein